MKLTITMVRKVCEAAGAKQAVVVVFDGQGGYAAVSYGRTRELCGDVKPLCDEIADSIDAGTLPVPAFTRPEPRRGSDVS